MSALGWVDSMPEDSSLLIDGRDDVLIWPSRWVCLAVAVLFRLRGLRGRGPRICRRGFRGGGRGLCDLSWLVCSVGCRARRGGGVVWRDARFPLYWVVLASGCVSCHGL